MSSNGAKFPLRRAFSTLDWIDAPTQVVGGVLLPILGRPYGEALEQGEIELRYDAHEGSFSLWYFDHRLPVRARAVFRNHQIRCFIPAGRNASLPDANY